MKKFELTAETKIVFGKTLHRIRALIDIRVGLCVVVRAGELGGWIEKEDNLSHAGNAWVGDDARVYGNAWVGDDAWVYGNAWVGDDAVVKTKNHYLLVGPIGSRNDTTTFFRNAAGIIKVKCGCFHGSIEAFLTKVTETHGDSKHAVAYRAAAALAKVQIDTTVIEEKPTKETAENGGQTT